VKELKNKIFLSVDGKKIAARPGTRLLAAALSRGIWIPNLCFIPEAELPFGGCRLCWVEVEGEKEPVTACTFQVREGMAVRTRGPRAERLRKSAFELLLSRHYLDCRNCPKNKNCGLQEIARRCGYPLKTGRFPRETPGLPVDDSHPKFIYDPNRCVLCGKCVWVCQTKAEGVLDFSRRGLACRVSTFADQPLGESKCGGCLKCVDICPVGSLVAKK
jgi:formate dehydrogenase major subunit/NADH-quinone oxidoreductase subunit G